MTTTTSGRAVLVALLGLPLVVSLSGAPALLPAYAQDASSLAGVTAPPDLDAWPASPPVTAAAHLLLDVDAGVVLAARDADEPRAVASTIKMLTAITARRLLPDPDAVVVVGPEVDVGGASTGLDPGNQRTVRQLLEALLVRSGNDAAEALAVAAAGTRPAFIAELRRDADRLGLDGAVLASPSGLEDRNRLTARHLAQIALALLEDPLLAEVVDLPRIDVPGLGTLENRNELVLTDPSVTGVKTGYTDQAGNSVVVSAERGSRTLLVVVLGSPDPAGRFADAVRLLDHASGFMEVAPSGSHVVACAGPDGVLPPPAALLPVPLGVTLRSVPQVVGCEGPDATALVLVDGEPWVAVPSRIRRPAQGQLDPDAAVGRAVVDAVQTALRGLGSSPPDRSSEGHAGSVGSTP